MPPSIGSETLVLLRGVMNPMGRTLEEITRPAVDGVSFRLEAKRSEPVSLVSLIDLADAAAAVTKLAAYQALIGTLVTVVDGHGQSHTNVMVRDVRPLEQRHSPMIVGGLNVSPAGAGIKLACQWTVQTTEVPA